MICLLDKFIVLHLIIPQLSMGSLTPQGVFPWGISPLGDQFGVHPYLLLINHEKTIMSHIYIKNLGSITQTFVLQGFLQGLTSMTTNLNQHKLPIEDSTWDDEYFI